MTGYISLSYEPTTFSPPLMICHMDSYDIICHMDSYNKFNSAMFEIDTIQGSYQNIKN